MSLTCESLLETGTSKAGRAELATKTGITEGQLLKFVNAADLMRIHGVGGEYAELLEAAGVDSAPELGQRSAANLAAKLKDVNQKKKLVRALPTDSQVNGWIEQAKALPKIVSH